MLGVVLAIATTGTVQPVAFAHALESPSSGASDAARDGAGTSDAARARDAGATSDAARVPVSAGTRDAGAASDAAGTRDAAGASDTARATETAQATDAAGASETARATDTAQATETAQATDAAGASETARATDTAQATDTAGVSASAAASRNAPRGRACSKMWRRWCCDPGAEVCTRSGAARWVLFSVGALAVAGGVGTLFVLGDRWAGDDPATMLLASGSFAVAAAALGAVAGRLGADGDALPDRVRTETLGLSAAIDGTSVIDEARPPILFGNAGPTLWFVEGTSRLRLMGYLGGMLGTRVDTDPRPQAAVDGTAPVVRQSHEIRAGLGLDMAVGLPYPVMRPHRSAFLGRAELRWKPEAHLRWDRVEDGGGQERRLERSMLLPLTIGIRWHLSPRQRFTVYLGPRFDIVSFRGPGDGALRRGKVELGPLYGEVWYEIDVPLNPGARGDGRPRRTAMHGLWSVAYIHSRFDGMGINLGAAVGFLGPVDVRWTMRIRPLGSVLAWQPSVGVRIGGGVRAWVALGLVLPDLHWKRRRRG